MMMGDPMSKQTCQSNPYLENKCSTAHKDTTDMQVHSFAHMLLRLQ